MNFTHMLDRFEKEGKSIFKKDSNDETVKKVMEGYVSMFLRDHDKVLNTIQYETKEDGLCVSDGSVSPNLKSIQFNARINRSASEKLADSIYNGTHCVSQNGFSQGFEAIRNIDNNARVFRLAYRNIQGRPEIDYCFLCTRDFVSADAWHILCIPVSDELCPEMKGAYKRDRCVILYDAFADKNDPRYINVQKKVIFVGDQNIQEDKLKAITIIQRNEMKAIEKL